MAIDITIYIVLASSLLTNIGMLLTKIKHCESMCINCTMADANNSNTPFKKDGNKQQNEEENIDVSMSSSRVNDAKAMAEYLRKIKRYNELKTLENLKSQAKMQEELELDKYPV